MTNQPGARGFTVVELITTISLLGILAVVAISRLTSANAYQPSITSNAVIAELRLAQQFAFSRQHHHRPRPRRLDDTSNRPLKHHFWCTGFPGNPVQWSTGGGPELGLADTYLQAILARRYNEFTPVGGIPACSPSTTPCSNIGLDGEIRQTFDDVDDFHGLDEIPPLGILGNPLTEYSGYRVKVAIAYLTPSEVTDLDLDGPTDAKRVPSQ